MSDDGDGGEIREELENMEEGLDEEPSTLRATHEDDDQENAIREGKDRNDDQPDLKPDRGQNRLLLPLLRLDQQRLLLLLLLLLQRPTSPPEPYDELLDRENEKQEEEQPVDDGEEHPLRAWR